MTTYFFLFLTFFHLLFDARKASCHVHEEISINKEDCNVTIRCNRSITSFFNFFCLLPIRMMVVVVVEE